MRRLLRAVLAGGLFLWTSPPPAFAKPAPHRAPPLRIRRIRIIRRDIFDTKLPAENKKIYRFVNSLHFFTKETAIRVQLLLKEGDDYNADLAKESERALRNILRLRNVKVTPVPINKKTVDVLVTVQETWTTEPQFGVSGVGSNLNLKIGLREQNLLGYGKEASYFYRKTDGIISRTYSYADPNVAGSPLTLDGDYQDRADGAVRSLIVAKPFRATITPWAADSSYFDDKHDVKVLDNLGQEVETLRSESKDVAGSVAHSLWSTTRRVRRAKVGYRRLQSDLFHTAPRSPVRQDLYHIFRVGFELERVNFITVNHIQQYDRDEDYQLGPAVNFEGGASRRKWVPTSLDANFFTGEVRQGVTFGPSHFALMTVTGAGKYRDGKWDSSTVSGDASYFNHFQPRQTLACHLGTSAILNPDKGTQLLLGGDTGLRGYRLNQFAGNKKLLANVEDRFFVVDDVARFMSVGWVVFTDAGYTWAPGHNIRVQDVKMDVGTGMRLYLSRTSQGHVLRFDLAYAVKRVGEQNRLIFTFGTSQAF